MPEHPTIIFDGLCNLCESTVRFIIRRDPEARFRFASAQSERGQNLCETHGIGEDALDTVVLLKGREVHTKSDAFLQIARDLTGPWRFIILLNAIPRPLRDHAYSFLASHRYAWFGRKPECWTPPGDIRCRFLD